MRPRLLGFVHRHELPAERRFINGGYSEFRGQLSASSLAGRHASPHDVKRGELVPARLGTLVRLQSAGAEECRSYRNSQIVDLR
jgi:hypothetical protein